MRARAASGHWENLLCNALDGSEDCLGSGTAARMWEEIGMPTKRAVAIKEVEAGLAAGHMRWESAQDLVQPFPRRGVLDEYAEGQDDEGEAPADKLGATAKTRPLLRPVNHIAT